MNTTNINPPKTGDILVVDDSVSDLELLAMILGKAGYQARLAANGELALQNVQASQPVLILLDVKMPGMDGFDVCRRLKKDALTRDIPVIFLTSIADPASSSRASSLAPWTI